MRTALSILLAMCVVASAAGFATASENKGSGSEKKAEKTEMKATGQEHEMEERHAKAKEIGDLPYHVANFMNWRASKIGVQILDENEDPFYLQEGKLKAEITRLDGSKEDVWLQGEGYEGADYDTVEPGATIYSRRLDWIREEPQASLRVWIPLPDGKTHEVTFNCLARDCPPEMKEAYEPGAGSGKK